MVESESLGVLVDTNVLIYTYKGFDPFNAVLTYLNFKPKFYIHVIVLEELSNFLKDEYSLNYRKARTALLYLEGKRGEWEKIDLCQEEKGDNAILCTAISAGLWIFTNDRRLKQRALKRGVPVIYMRDRGKIINSFDM